MHLKRLWYLQLIIDKGSFAAAAGHAGVSQPALSKAMKVLEGELGVPLFQPSGRSKRPTAKALHAAKTASRLHSDLESLAKVGSGQDRRSRQRGVSLRVGVAPAAAILYGPCIQAIWQAREPDGFVEFVGGSGPALLERLRHRELDFIIAPRPRHEVTSDAEWMFLHRSVPTIYARTDHPLRNATSLHGVRHACWAVAGHANTAGSVIEETHRVRKLPRPRIVAQCQDYQTMLSLVARTDLLCVVPHPALTRGIAGQAGIAPLNIREGLAHYAVGAFWLRAQSPANLALLQVMLPALQALADTDRVREDFLVGEPPGHGSTSKTKPSDAR